MAINSDIVYFIRVPKTGSQSMSGLIKHLSFINSFDVYLRPSRLTATPLLDVDTQEKFALDVLAVNKSAVYIGMHENFIEFRSFNFPVPMFISLVRDPVEKVISWFYYVRSSLYDAKRIVPFLQTISEEDEAVWRNKSFETCVLTQETECLYERYGTDFMSDYRRQSLQFCGHNPICLRFDSPIAIQIAKENLERNFIVVGSWEEANITLTVLEHYLPRYFKRASEYYNSHLNSIKSVNHNQAKPVVNEFIKNLVRKNFTNELDFYNFCLQRLYKQYLAVVDLSKF